MQRVRWILWKALATSVKGESRVKHKGHRHKNKRINDERNTSRAEIRSLQELALRLRKKLQKHEDVAKVSHLRQLLLRSRGKKLLHQHTPNGKYYDQKHPTLPD